MPTKGIPTTGAGPSYGPPQQGVGWRWQLVVLGLLATALSALSVHSVCRLDVAGAKESALGVRHEKHGAVWYHCEPWIVRMFGD